MKFIVHADAFTASPAQNGVIPIRSLATRRMLFMKETAACLLSGAPEWRDFDGYTSDMAPDAARDVRDALTLLTCFDLAECEEEKDASPCRVAGERDYRALALFMADNMARGISSTPVRDAAYYSEDSLRYRQFNNMEYNFLLEKDGKIASALNVAVPGEDQLSNAAFFQSVVFDEGMTEEESLAAFRALIDYACEAFRGDLNKFRFAVCSDDAGKLIAALPEMGFRVSTTLKDEMGDGRDLILYDRVIAK